MKNFKQVYQFPLKTDEYGHKAYTNDDNMAFDFAEKWLDGNAWTVSKEEEAKIVYLLNQEVPEALEKHFEYTFNSTVSTIFIGVGATMPIYKPFIIIRGWGHLTGKGGGLGLPANEGKRLQREFAEFIIDRLQGKR
jgi:hypothetical protein